MKNFKTCIEFFIGTVLKKLVLSLVLVFIFSLAYAQKSGISAAKFSQNNIERLELKINLSEKQKEELSIIYIDHWDYIQDYSAKMMELGKQKVKSEKGNLKEIRKKMMKEFQLHRNQKIIEMMECIYQLMEEDQKPIYQTIIDTVKKNKKID